MKLKKDKDYQYTKANSLIFDRIIFLAIALFRILNWNDNRKTKWKRKEAFKLKQTILAVSEGKSRPRLEVDQNETRKRTFLV